MPTFQFIAVGFGFDEHGHQWQVGQSDPFDASGVDEADAGDNALADWKARKPPILYHRRIGIPAGVEPTKWVVERFKPQP